MNFVTKSKIKFSIVTLVTVIVLALAFDNFYFRGIYMHKVEGTVVKKIERVASNKPVYRMTVKIDNNSGQTGETLKIVEVRCQKDCPWNGKVNIQVYKVPLLNYKNYFYNGT